MSDEYWNSSEYRPLSWDYLDDTQTQLMFNSAVTSAYAPLHLIEVNETDPYNPINYLGGMQEAMKVAERDLWGNARIPALELLTGYNAEDPYAWVNVSDSKPPTYESLVGMKIHGLPRGSFTNTTVQVEAAYTTFNCSPWSNLTEWLRENPRGLVYANTTNETELFYAPYRMTNVFLDILNPAGDDDAHSHPDFGTTLVVGHTNNGYSDYWSDDPDEYDLDAVYRNYITLCTVGTTHLDLLVACTRTTTAGDTSCAAQRARHSPHWPLQPSTTIFNAGNTASWWQYFSYIPSLLKLTTTTTPTTNTTTTSPSASFTWTSSTGATTLAIPYGDVSTALADTLTNMRLTATSSAYTSAYLDAVALPTLNARLAHLVNSYWRLNLNGAAGLGGVDGADKYTLKARSSPYFAAAPSGGAARALRDPPAYRVRGAYFSLYAVAAAVMLACALAAGVMRIAFAGEAAEGEVGEGAGC
ncbi:hypothetical protein SLS58_010964 [Diplodia intermedia]|uniref:Uncharacterized protein n=1 Tax=Diplodia intermedia TaxID=856260 RepID=A0ABR3T2G3_9PEZI